MCLIVSMVQHLPPESRRIGRERKRIDCLLLNRQWRVVKHEHLSKQALWCLCNVPGLPCPESLALWKICGALFSCWLPLFGTREAGLLTVSGSAGPVRSLFGVLIDTGIVWPCLQSKVHKPHLGDPQTAENVRWRYQPQLLERGHIIELILQRGKLWPAKSTWVSESHWNIRIHTRDTGCIALNISNRIVPKGLRLIFSNRLARIFPG